VPSTGRRASRRCRPYELPEPARSRRPSPGCRPRKSISMARPADDPLRTVAMKSTTRIPRTRPPPAIPPEPPPRHAEPGGRSEIAVRKHPSTRSADPSVALRIGTAVMAWQPERRVVCDRHSGRYASRLPNAWRLPTTTMLGVRRRGFPGRTRSETLPAQWPAAGGGGGGGEIDGCTISWWSRTFASWISRWSRFSRAASSRAARWSSSGSTGSGARRCAHPAASRGRRIVGRTFEDRRMRPAPAGVASEHCAPPAWYSPPEGRVPCPGRAAASEQCAPRFRRRSRSASRTYGGQRRNVSARCGRHSARPEAR
jgi:hypothetical protein